jgi:hypothetical protein
MNKIQLLLDSGAYSAFKKSETLDLKDYIKYVQEQKHLLWNYVNMDVMPPRKKDGERRTPAESEAAAKASYANLQEMKAHGLKPIPVFHRGEDWYWLERMLKDGEDYIGFSLSGSPWGDGAEDWMDTLYRILTNQNGDPIVKIHGFAITGIRRLLRYPFYSVDSTSWNVAGSYGWIQVPPRNERTGEFDYLSPPEFVSITNQGRNTKSKKLKVADTFGDIKREWMIRYLEKEVGVELAQARNSHIYRIMAGIVLQKGISRSLPRIRYDASGNLIDDREPSHQKAISYEPLKMFFAINTDRDHNWLMNQAQVQYRLLSYYETRTEREDFLEQLATKGIFGKLEYVKKIPKKADWKSQRYRSHRSLALIARLAEGDTDGSEDFR